MNCMMLHRNAVPFIKRTLLPGLRGAAVLLGMACCAGIAAANEADELAADQISVRELMRLETAQALQRLQTDPSASGRNALPQRALASASGEGSSAQLLAIYGVGRKLMAQIQVDGQTLLFVRGRPEAVGPGKAHAMRLLDITARCVEVSMGGRRESLCAAQPAIRAG